MARWTGTWLSGLGAAGVQAPAEGWRGRRLGLPPEGPGAVATTGSRVAAFMLDAVASGLVVLPFFADPTDSRRGLAGVAVLAVMNIVLLPLTGQTFAMRLLGIQVHALSGNGRPSFLAACIRTALLTLLLPALVFDRDGRGLHDKAAGTVVVRTRSARPFGD